MHVIVHNDLHNISHVYVDDMYMYMHVDVHRSHSSPWLLAILSSRTSGVLPTILRMSGRMLVLKCGSLEGGRENKGKLPSTQHWSV